MLLAVGPLDGHWSGAALRPPATPMSAYRDRLADSGQSQRSDNPALRASCDADRMNGGNEARRCHSRHWPQLCRWRLSPIHLLIVYTMTFAFHLPLAIVIPRAETGAWVPWRPDTSRNRAQPAGNGASGRKQNGGIVLSAMQNVDDHHLARLHPIEDQVISVTAPA